MKVLLDENNYFTGNYATIGDIEGAIEIDSLPDEKNEIKLKCYKYIDGEWKFDNTRYQMIIETQRAKQLSQLKKQMIRQSKSDLEQYLESYKLTSFCHQGIEKQYSITSEKQSHLASMILTAQAATASGAHYQPSWNATGEECTYDWTIEELIQLAMEMESVVRPLVSRQQSLEVAIKNAATLDELESIDITFTKGGESNLE